MCPALGTGWHRVGAQENLQVARSLVCLLLAPGNPWSHQLWFLSFFLFFNTEMVFILFIYFCFLGLHPQHVEVPRLGVKSELQLLVCTTATATRGLSRVCNLHYSSQQHQILNSLREARDQTCIFMDTSWIHFCWATMGNCFRYFWFSIFFMSGCVPFLIFLLSFLFIFLQFFQLFN